MTAETGLEADAGPAAPAAAVRLEWAWHGKRAGQRDDYGVLWSSGMRLKATQFDRIIRQFSPGTPTGPNPGQPDELPWVTLTSMRIGGEPYVGLAIREWPDDAVPPVDAFGRTIIGTRFFCLRLADFRVHFGTFRALYATVAGRRPGTEGEEVWVESSAVADDPAALLAAHPAAARIAARLLDGQVGLVPQSYPALADRLDLIDAVTALLPGGARVAFSASSWADRRASHQLRLAFTQRSGAGSNDVDPGEPYLTEPPAETVGGRYAHNLTALRQWLADDLTALAGTLAADTRQCSFGQPEEFVAAVAAPIADDAVRAHDRGDDRSLRAALATLAPPVDLAGRLLRLFLPTATADDVGLVAAHWVPAALPALAARCRVLAGDGADASTPQIHPFLRLAEDFGVLPDLADQLLTAADPVAVELGVDIVRLRGEGEPWEPLRDRIAANSNLALQLVTTEVERNLAATQSLSLLLRWLAPGATVGTLAVLRPFQLAVGDRSGADPVEPTVDLDAFGERSAFALLTLAGRHRALPPLLPALDRWLTRATLSFTPTQRDRWIRFVDGLEVDGLKRGRWKKIRRAWLERLGNPNVSVDTGAALAPDGGPAELEVTWLASDRQPGTPIRGLVERHLPYPTDLAFVGDADGTVAVIGQDAPDEAPWCCTASYEELAASGAQLPSYVAAAFEARLRRDARLVLAEIPPDRLAAVIDRFGFGSVASVAAALLQGQVTVLVAGDRPGRRERLDFIGAVAALLPGGALASFTACTGQPIDPAAFHLDFRPDGADVRGRFLVEWPVQLDGARQFVGAAKVYSGRLLRLRHVIRDTAEIVRALADDDAPLDLDRPEPMLSVPSGDRPVFQVEVGPAVEAARRTIQAALAGKRTRGRAADALYRLVTEGGVQDLEIAHRYVVRSRETGAAGSVLYDVVSRQPRDRARSRRARAAAVWLVRECRTAGRTDYSVELGEVVDAIARDPAAAVELIVQDVRCRAAQSWTGWLDALAERGPLAHALLPFDAILRRRPPVDSAVSRAALGMRELVSQGPDAVAALVRVAEVADWQLGSDSLPWVLDELERLPAEGLGPAVDAYRSALSRRTPAGPDR